MQEFQIQSNIPVLILTIALIVITVLGFLEFKKLSNRIDSIMSNIDSIKGNSEGESNVDDNKDDEMKLSNIYSMEPDEIRENIQDNPPENIINQDKYEENYEEQIVGKNDNKVREYIESSQPKEWATKSLIIAQSIKADDFTISKGNDNKIEELNSDSEDDSYSESDSDSDSESDEGDKKYSSEYDYDSDEENKEEEVLKNDMINISEMLNTSKDVQVDNIDEMNTVQMLLNGVQGEELEKELKEDTGVSSNVEVNENMSVNELKQICKDKGLSVSGNKGKLISRIKENN